MRFETITLLLVTAVLAACGSVRDRGACVASSDCPVAHYCITTGGKGACVADAVPPTVSGVTVTCLEPVGAGTTCRRDGVLRVQATVTDDREVTGAEASFDVGGAPVPLARGSANVWVADVRLATLPFGYFDHAVLTTVAARDAAGNGTAVGAAGVGVTRRRFARTLDTGVVSPGHPAVMQDGTVAVAGMNGKVYFVPWDGEGISSVVSVSGWAISAAPLANGGSLWIGSEDGKVYDLKKEQSAVSAVVRCDTTRPVRGSLGATATGYVLAATDTGRLYSTTAKATNCAGISSKGVALSLGPAIDFDGAVYLGGGSTLRRLAIDEIGVPVDDPTFSATSIASGVVDSLVPSSGAYAVTTNLTDGHVYRAAHSETTAHQIAATFAPSGGLVMLSDGTMVLPEATATLSKWLATAGASAVWRTAPLNGIPRTPLVLNGAAQLIASTDVGSVHALRPDGTIAWSAQLSAGTASLQPGNIYTPPGQVAGEELSTAYFAGADGVLHAIIVDGKLDASAPWPKVFHDPQNTNRAGAQP